jgi:hypothetical protein
VKKKVEYPAIAEAGRRALAEMYFPREFREKARMKRRARKVPKNPIASWPVADETTAPMTIVTFYIEEKYARDYPTLVVGEHYLFLGEINRMRGHCALVNVKGLVMWGYHTNNFRIVPREAL